MLVKLAGIERDRRYDRWYPLLEEEVKLVAAPNAVIVAVGSTVYQYLKQKRFPRSITQVIHYSALAGNARKAGIVGREADFQAFKDSVSDKDLYATAEDVLTSARVPAEIREDTLSRLKSFAVTTSRQQLIFNYMEAFKKLMQS